ncbi:MAG: Cof-type HAD-IIB family hydrolase [Oscillospiraceae bacterium]|nr:Cof-type HAD-IIB family hydrolase [Oscillospiraceae bacterium]
MIKAAFFDVDGTLLSHKTKSVSQSAREAVAVLRAAGVKCIVATGRQMQEMQKLPVANMEFDGYITLNGQLILDGEKNILSGTPLTGRAKEFLLRAFAEKRFPALLVEEEDVYLNFEDERVRALQAAISSPIPPLGEYSGREIYQVCAYLNPEDEHLVEEIAGACVMTRWAFGGMDIIAEGGGKITGIKRYLEENGIAPEETIAFGDGENDIEMLRFAGIGVAMGNAWDNVKAAADYVTADIDQDGVAEALRHFGLI